MDEWSEWAWIQLDLLEVEALADVWDSYELGERD